MAGYIKTEKVFVNSDFRYGEFGVSSGEHGEEMFCKEENFPQKNEFEATEQHFRRKNTPKEINENRATKEQKYQKAEAMTKKIIPSVIRHTACPEIRLAYYRVLKSK